MQKWVKDIELSQWNSSFVNEGDANPCKANENIENRYSLLIKRIENIRNGFLHYIKITKTQDIGRTIIHL